MKDDQYPKHLFELCMASVFISTSSVLGNYIAMPPPVIIWWRCALAVIFLFIYTRYRKINLKIKSKKDVMTFIIGAALLGAHWVTYFYALKLSNVAMGMLSLYTYPVLTALLEPLFIKIKLNPIHIVLGLMVLAGIYVLVPEFDFKSSYITGVMFGIISALFYALRLLILKKQVYKYDGTMLMFYQVLIAGILLSPVMFFMETSGIRTQYPYVLLLAILTTSIGHTMMIHSLKYFSVSTSSIISSAQPIYGIIMAYFFLNEIPTWNTFYGGLLILSTVIIESIRSKNKPIKA